MVRFSIGDSDCWSTPLVQAFTSTACRFITGENAQLVVLLVLKKPVRSVL